MVDFQLRFDDGKSAFGLDDVLLEGVGRGVELGEDSCSEDADDASPENETHPKYGIEIDFHFIDTPKA